MTEEQVQKVKQVFELSLQVNDSIFYHQSSCCAIDVYVYLGKDRTLDLSCYYSEEFKESGHSIDNMINNLTDHIKNQK